MNIRFGVQIEPQFGYDFTAIKNILYGAEKHNFTSAWFSDHFMLNKDATQLTSYECFTAMMFAAANTTKLRIGSLVFSNSYRHPAVLAKQIAGLDQFSNGRIDFGYGAGWKELEYSAYGIPYPSAGTRIKQLAEGIEVIRKLWTEERVNYKGEHYSLTDAISYPKPVQQPLPIWVGTMEAKPKMLQLAAKHADGINIAWAFSPDVYQEKLNRIHEYCEREGRNPKTLRKSYGAWTRVYPDEETKIQIWQKIADQRNMTLEEVSERYESSLHGTAEEIIEKLRAYIKVGISDFIFMFPQNQEVESMRLFNEYIIPKL